jgi:hypothetical protein
METYAEDIREYLRAGMTKEAAEALIGLVMYSNAYEPAESLLLELSKHQDSNVRGNAVLGFGHLARVHRRSSAKAVEVVTESLRDADGYVRGQANSAADDINLFSDLKVRKQQEV